MQGVDFSSFYFSSFVIEPAIVDFRNLEYSVLHFTVYSMVNGQKL